MEGNLFERTAEMDEARWEDLVTDSLRYRPGLLEGWKQVYGGWLGLYGQFRGIEEATMYAAGAEGKVPQPSANTRRLHRNMIGTLMANGETLMENLSRLHEKLTKEEREHSEVCQMRLGTLLESLRESMELWHPANTGGGVGAAALFGT